jgi:hypothetical protein
MDVPENVLKHEIVIFPSPSNRITTIEVSGNVNNHATVEIIDFSNFKSGSYLVKTKTNERIYTKSLVKQ